MLLDHRKAFHLEYIHTVTDDRGAENVPSRVWRLMHSEMITVEKLFIDVVSDNKRDQNRKRLVDDNFELESLKRAIRKLEEKRDRFWAKYYPMTEFRLMWTG